MVRRLDGQAIHARATRAGDRDRGRGRLPYVGGNGHRRGGGQPGGRGAHGQRSVLKPRRTLWNRRKQTQTVFLLVSAAKWKGSNHLHLWCSHFSISAIRRGPE